MKKILLPFLALFLITTFPAWAVFYNPSLPFYSVKTEHFTIHYPKSVAPITQDLLKIVEPVYEKLTAKYQWRPAGRTHVVLVDETDRPNGLATVIPANYMYLHVTPPHPDSSLDNYYDYLEMLFTHEFTHIIHIDQHNRFASPAHWLFGKIVAPNGLTPSWMREGMAINEESQLNGRGRNHFSYTEMLLRTSIYEGHFPKIDEAAGLSLKWPRGETAYVYGGKFFQWLAEKYGEDRIQRYMKEYASGLWLFSLNNKARRVYNKSFYQLWKDWQAELQAKYGELRKDLEAKGVTSTIPLVKGEEFYSYPTPHPESGGYAYAQEGIDEGSRIILIAQPGAKPLEIKRKSAGQLSYSRDGGNFLAMGSLSSVEKYRSYDEVLIYDIVNRKMRRAYEEGARDRAMRASDPDFSPADGGARWLTMVRTGLSTDNLYAYDIAKKKGYYLTDLPRYTQLANPRYSPDGASIVVSQRDPKGNRDIVLYSKTGQFQGHVTHDEAIDTHPVWAPDGRSIYYGSDASGIPNIYRYDVARKVSSPVTNVLSGVYQPAITPNGQTLYVQYYTSRGPELHRIELDAKKWGMAQDSAAPQTLDFPVARRFSLKSEFVSAPALPSLWGSPFNADDELEEGSDDPEKKEKGKKETTSKEIPPSAYENSLTGKPIPQEEAVTITGTKKYNSFPQILLPRYIMPTFATLEDSFLLGFSLGRYDPLLRHSWTASTNYRSDANFVGGGATYAFVRYNPSFFIGFDRYAVNWGRIFANSNLEFFEQRHRGYIGTDWGLGNHRMGLTYFFEKRAELTNVANTFATLDNYAGFRYSYIYGRYRKFPNSISQENGPLFKLYFDYTDAAFGSAQANEQKIVIGDLRYYFEMPWSDHHVFAVRSSTGWVWGDRETFAAGALRFGGPFGEGTLAAVSSRLFEFRGLPGVAFAGDRALLFSAEYRLPLFTINRGPGTWPIFFRKIYAVPFVDYGDIWSRNGLSVVGSSGLFDDFLMSSGMEMRADVVAGYGLPLTARLGYGVILMNRWRIPNLTDQISRSPIRNGTFYLQFGTSF